MADPTRIIPVSLFKSYAGISDTNSDVVLGYYCDAVTAFVNNYCNRDFRHQTHTVSLDGNDDEYLRNLDRPITAVTSISVNDTALDLVTEAANDNYFLYSAEGKIYYGGGFPAGNQNIALVYKAGYEDTNMPADLVQACAILISLVWEKAGKITALSEGTPAGYSKAFIDLAIPDIVKEILNRYMLMTKPNLGQSFFIDVI